MDSGKPSAIRHKTSVEAAKTAYSTISHLGQKRTFDTFKGDQKRVPNAPLADVTNKTEFRRPSLPTKTFEPLKASEILDVTDRPEGPSEYSQRRALALTPTPQTNPVLDLSHPSYGLPRQLVTNLASLGVKSIYPWQSDCLLKSGALSGNRNLVYTAPTGGGKSLVADILMVKKVLENPGQKAILVLPYVALVQEKLRWLRKVVEGIQTPELKDDPRPERPSFWRKNGNENTIRVVGSFGGSREKILWDDIDIAVCTIEKANSLVNLAIDEHSVSKLGVVVMDELHMIDDEGRGYILELMCTKLLSLEQDVQLIGMSATLNNADVLARWLNDARFYISRYRPVPVEEHLVFDNNIYPASTSSGFYKTATQLSASPRLTSSQAKPSPVRTIQTSKHKEFHNPLLNAVVSLANETARAGYGALIFCSSRAGSESAAVLISQVLPRPEEIPPSVMELRVDLLSELRNTSTGLDHVLEKTIPVGVAFHHAGLTAEERDLIAAAYDAGIIKVIVATCSLAAGINLPARRVILYGARMGAEFVGPAMLRQMRGRAGRKGKDEVGETYLCCQKSDLEAVAELMEADLPNVESCLLPDKRGIQRALLEVIATKLATSEESIDDYMKKTLLSHSINRQELVEMSRTTLESLVALGLVKSHLGTYEASLLGQAIVASSLTPEDGLFVHRELSRALQSFVMDGDMHALYTFTPVHTNVQSINWQIFQREMEGLDEANLRALTLVGLKPSIINKMAQGGTMRESTPAEIESARIYKRFYSALQLRDICNEMPIYAVSRKYDMPRGVVQNLAQTCNGFAAGMIRFCQKMDWGGLAAVLDHYSDRLRAGAKSDLLELAGITGIKSRTARVFWENGFKTVASVAAANPKEILPVLLMAQPRKPKLDSQSEQKYIEKLQKRAEVISNSANRIWERQMQAELDREEEE